MKTDRVRTIDSSPESGIHKPAREALRALRILFLLNDFEGGGAEFQAFRLGRYLREETAAEVGFFGFGSLEGPIAALCTQYGIQVRSLSSKFKHFGRLRSRPWRLLEFARALRPFRPDLVLSFNDSPNIMAGIMWRGLGARACIWNQRNPRSPMSSRLVRLAVRLCPCFVSNSEAGVVHLTEVLSVPSVRTRVIRNAVSLSPPEADRVTWRRRLGVTPDRFLACKVANLRSAKDHATLLHIWKRVVGQTEGNQAAPILLLAGKWEDEAAHLRQMANELGLYDEVRFLGFIQDVSGLLGAVDLGVFCSESEGCPNGVLECMAAGLPVVATDIPGNREALGNQSEGSLVPLDAMDMFADRVKELIYNPRAREELGLENRQRILSEFSPKRVHGQMAYVIATMMNGTCLLSRGGV